MALEICIVHLETACMVGCKFSCYWPQMNLHSDLCTLKRIGFRLGEIFVTCGTRNCQISMTTFLSHKLSKWRILVQLKKNVEMTPFPSQCKEYADPTPSGNNFYDQLSNFDDDVFVTQVVQMTNSCAIEKKCRNDAISISVQRVCWPHSLW